MRAQRGIFDSDILPATGRFYETSRLLSKIGIILIINSMLNHKSETIDFNHNNNDKSLKCWPNNFSVLTTL